MKALKRIFYHVMRFRNNILYGAIASTIFMLFFGLFYPKDSIEQIVETFVNLGLFGDLSKVDAGWGVWISFMVGLFLYLTIAIISIEIGAKTIPTKQNQGSEFFMGSNPMNPRLFYIENVIAGLIAVAIVLLPTFLVILIQTWYFNGLGILRGITLTFLMLLLVALFFISLTSMTSSIFFQTNWSKGIGYSYMFYGFLMELLKGNPALEGTSDYSINAYLKLSTLVTAKTIDWDPSYIVTLISGLFLVIGFFAIKYPQYLEKARSKDRFSPIDATIGRLVAPTTRFAKRYPYIVEQLRRDKVAIVVVALIYMLWIPAFWSALAGAGDQLATLMEGFDTPTTRALAQGHDLDMTLKGFSVMKFFSNHWMFFGIYPMLVAASIPTRDVRTHSQDVVYGSNVKPGNLVNHRVIAMIIEMTVLYWLAFLVAFTANQSQSPQFIKDFVGPEVLFQFFFVSWITYTAFAIFLVGIAMLPKDVSKGRRLAIGAFIFSWLINVIAYLNSSIEFIRYFSVLNYYKPVEIVYGEISMTDSVLMSTVTLVVCTLFFAVIKKYRYEHNSFY